MSRYPYNASPSCGAGFMIIILFAAFSYFIPLPHDAFAGILDEGATKSYETREKILNQTIVLVMDPLLLQGDFDNNVKVSLDDTDTSRSTGRGLIEGAVSTLRNKGYGAMEQANNANYLNDVDEENLWKKYGVYSEAGRHEKSKLEPYSIGRLGSSIGEQNRASAVLLIKCFANYNVSKNDLDKEGAVKIIGSAIILPLTGMIASSGSSSLELKYKFGLFDLASGELIWYKEGFSNLTNIMQTGMVARLVEEHIMYDFPKRKIKYEMRKFSKKRSEVASEQ